MGLQKYRFDDVGPVQLNGATPMLAQGAHASLAGLRDCPCDDGKRRTVYVTGEPDSAFARPAACFVKGKSRRGYLASTEGGLTFRFYDREIAAMGVERVGLDEMTGNPVDWLRYGVSFGNGNDGVSRLYPSFIVHAPPLSAGSIAVLALITSGCASRRWIKANAVVEGGDEHGASAMLLDPPGDRQGHWSEANGAWRVVEVFPAEQASDRSEAPTYLTPSKAFGIAEVKAYWHA